MTVSTAGTAEMQNASPGYDATRVSLELQQDVEQFYYREARLLDGRQYQTWLTLCSESIRYVMPARTNPLVDNAERANRFNISVQDRSSRHPGVRGGVKGSHPVDGGYMTYRYPNWAAKFFMDAAMARDGIAGAIWPASHGG